MLRMQIGFPKLLLALLLLVLFGNLKPLYAASGLAAPLKNMPIYADYDWELREAAPRADGYVHVDTPALIARLAAGHITTYAYLCLHQASDWDDFRLEFMPAAQAAGINVWLYLAPPTELPSNFPPYGWNYVSWATAAGQLAQTYPNLTGLCVDDFDSNEGTFTPSYVNSMMAAAHAYSPGMAFLPVNYDSAHDNNIGKTISTTFVNNYGKYCSGVIFPYLNMSNMGDYSGMAANISKNANILGSIPMVVMIYDGGYGSWYPSADYLTQANNIAQAAVSAGTARGGICQYKMDKSSGSWEFPIIQADYNSWALDVNHISSCVAMTSDNREEVFAIGSTGYLYHQYQTTPEGSWSGWIAMGTSGNIWSQNAKPAVGVNPDGRLEVCIVGLDGRINHIFQLTPGSSATANWSPFEILDSTAIVSPTAKVAIGHLANGQEDVFVIGRDGGLYHDYVGANGWTGFSSLGGNWSQDADIAVNQESDGREEVFLIGTTGYVYNNWQTTANGTTWNGWNELKGIVSDTVRTGLGRNVDGRLEIFTLGSDGVCYHMWEESANSPTAWSAWSSLGGTWDTNAKPVVASDQNGALEVFLIGNIGNIYHNYETSNGWSGWLNLGGSFFEQNVQPCVGTPSGMLDLFTTTGLGSGLWHFSQTAPNSPAWSGWSNLGGSWQ